MVKITEAHSYTVRTLRQLEKKTPKARIRLRFMAVRLAWKGYPVASADDILGVSDNAKIHHAKIHHAKIRQPYREDHPELELRFLPPYSPNLNHTERLWKWPREKGILNTR